MTIVVMVHYTYLDRFYFSLSDDISLILINWKLKNLLIKSRFFHFYFLNSDISVNIKVINIKFSVRFLKVRPEGCVAQIFYLGLDFNFMSKNG